METADARINLERLIAERREGYAGIARLLGKNPAYIQQFIKRGTPRKLSEEDRRILARYFNVDESVLGGPALETRDIGEGELISIPLYDVQASAGFGALDPNDRPTAHIGFERPFLERISPARPRDLSIIRVRGDSMSPMLNDGDDIMVDRGAAQRKLQDGIYVLRVDDTLIVKRLTVHPATGRLTIASDNPAYATWQDCDPADVSVIGRVVWAARCVR